MQLKQLGTTELRIPPIVFRGNVFGWTLDEAASHRMLDDLHGRGLTAIDTADDPVRQSTQYWRIEFFGGSHRAVAGSESARLGSTSLQMLL